MNDENVSPFCELQETSEVSSLNLTPPATTTEPEPPPPDASGKKKKRRKKKKSAEHLNGVTTGGAKTGSPNKKPATNGFLSNDVQFHEHCRSNGTSHGQNNHTRQLVPSSHISTTVEPSQNSRGQHIKVSACFMACFQTCVRFCTIVVLGPVTWCTLGVSFSFFVRNSDQIV